VDALVAGAGDREDAGKRYAAAWALTQLDLLGPVAAVLSSASVERQISLLQALRKRAKPLPELREILFEIAANTPDEDVRYLCHACNALGLEGPLETVRIARAAKGDRNVFQLLLQKQTLSADALDHLGAFLIETGAFQMSQFGLSDASQEGRLPADFVPRHWHAADPAMRIELCKFASLQLENYRHGALHKFLVDVAYTGDDVRVQSAAWSALYRWYDSFGYPRHRPLTISAESMATFFGSPREFLLRFARFLDGREILLETLHRDTFGQLLRYPDESALDAFIEAPKETLALMETVAKTMRDDGIDRILRLDCADFLGFIGWREEFREPVTRLLLSFRGTDLDLQSTRALERMAQIASTVSRLE
jgi:hypothetical protein